MIRFALLSGFFLVLSLEEILDLGLMLTPGLSAKNAFLFVLVVVVAFTRASERREAGLQLPDLHALFLILLTLAFIGIFYRQFVSGYSLTFSLVGELGLVKSVIVDSYLMLLVFFYGVVSRKAAMALSKCILLIISFMALVTIADLLGVSSLGLISYRNERLEGPLGQANEYAVFLSFFIPFLLLGALNGRGIVVRLIYLLGALVSFALLIQTGSRGGFVSLVGGIALAGIWLSGGYDLRRAFLWGATGVFAAAGIVTAVALSNEVVRELLITRLELSFSGGLEEASAGRTWIWMQGLDDLLARPWRLLTGFGLGQFTERVGIPPHSAYMNYLHALGLIGLAAYVIIVARILILGRRAFFSEAATAEERTLIAGLVIAWFALTIAMVTGTIYKAWLFVWPMTGLCLYVTSCIRDAERERGGVEKEKEVEPFIKPFEQIGLKT